MIKKGEKKNKYLDLAREQKTKLTVIPNVINVLGTVVKGFVKRLEDCKWEDKLICNRDLRRIAVIQTPVEYHKNAGV